MEKTKQEQANEWMLGFFQEGLKRILQDNPQAERAETYAELEADAVGLFPTELGTWVMLNDGSGLADNPVFTKAVDYAIDQLEPANG